MAGSPWGILIGSFRWEIGTCPAPDGTSCHSSSHKLPATARQIHTYTDTRSHSSNCQTCTSMLNNYIYTCKCVALIPCYSLHVRMFFRSSCGVITCTCILYMYYQNGIYDDIHVSNSYSGCNIHNLTTYMYMYSMCIMYLVRDGHTPKQSTCISTCTYVQI